jgi:nucleotidyltransferase/DNA polymerase involved in DNA repair
MPPETDESESTPSAGTAVSEIPGIGRSRSDELANDGYETVGDLRGADVDTLEKRTSIPRDVLESAVEYATPSGTEQQSSLADARKRAERATDAKVKTVKRNGTQQHKVLERVERHREPGATITVRKG